ncbi:hypothetical protein ACELLULO517_23415 [Acidisoma cellulosilytica]|uniref:Band 7 domain-containing protein n=1 Tax=Acidisoma cellulosilyticum TaxID=2802395 RepID=A0A964E6P3_9PROT|nr:SPFH domain-containing protein [Acidisoma cellulosilyticum]MCB8883218.1 hypothetical protein [Acidisoma cellulosilyticum]
MLKPDDRIEVTSLSVIPAFSDARRIARMLRRVAVVDALCILALVGTLAWMRRHIGALPIFGAMTHDGLTGAVIAALVVTLTGLLSCLLILSGRARSLDAKAVTRPSAVSTAAGWPQGLLILVGTVASLIALRALPPSAIPTTFANWPILIGLLTFPAFVFLIGERLIAAIPLPCLPERVALTALLRLPAAVLLAYAALLAARGMGVPLGSWAAVLIQGFVGLLAVELALRTLGIWFLPPRAPIAARAMIGSAVAALLQPGSVQPGRVAEKLRTQFGIDITRSWAMGYARTAAAPVLLGLLVFAWCLSGVVRVGLNARGSYERFGAPVAMLEPGLHILLPWPFGRVRMVEYGVVHAVALDTASEGSLAGKDVSTADGPPPPSANRLWDQRFVNETSYIIASAIGSRQSFETANVSINVLYRVGLTDADARLALYSMVDPASLVRSVAGQELAHFFVDRTLAEVLGERNEEIATGLKTAVQQDLDKQHSGLEVLSLIVESLHPPGGAAIAYRGVQTAQIIASMQYSQEQGRAHTTLSAAQSTAHNMRVLAQASAAERIDSARGEQSRADADILAHHEGGRAFLLERYFHNLQTALAQGEVEIVDHRLDQSQSAIVDLRPAAGTMATPVQAANAPYTAP